MTRRGGGTERSAAVLSALGLAVLISLASSLNDTSQQALQCCQCLTQSRNDFGELCVDDSAGQCQARIEAGEPVPSNPRCLRDLCGERCGALTGGLATRAQVEGCCTCLVGEHDPAGPACLGVSAEQCAQSLDNGHGLTSTRACFVDQCGTACSFLDTRAPIDGGTGDAEDGGVR